MHVLIVEDEIAVAQVLAEGLSDEGHETTVTQDGHEALALLEHWRPDVVFLDVKLGEFGGVEVLRRIRRMYAGLPVIVITGRATDEEREAIGRLGVTEILDKPFLLTHLTEALGSVLPQA